MENSTSNWDASLQVQLGTEIDSYFFSDLKNNLLNNSIYRVEKEQTAVSLSVNNMKTLIWYPKAKSVVLYNPGKLPLKSYRIVNRILSHIVPIKLSRKVITFEDIFGRVCELLAEDQCYIVDYDSTYVIDVYVGEYYEAVSEGAGEG